MALQVDTAVKNGDIDRVINTVNHLQQLKITGIALTTTSIVNSVFNSESVNKALYCQLIAMMTLYIVLQVKLVSSFILFFPPDTPRLLELRSESGAGE